MDYPSLILGIDPGASGGIAVVGAHVPGFCEAHKMGETENDTFELLQMYAPAVEFAFIEAVHAMPPSMPGNTSVASFAFGKSYGFLRGLLVGLRIPFGEVSPQRWKNFLGLTFGKEDSKKDKKNGSKQLAAQWFPQIKVTHAIAEAILIAEYGKRLRS